MKTGAASCGAHGPDALGNKKVPGACTPGQARQRRGSAGRICISLVLAAIVIVILVRIVEARAVLEVVRRF